MRFEGRVYRDGRFWLAEIPLIEALTQGKTRKEALFMTADWLETMVNRASFHAEVHERSGNEFELSGNDAGAMVAVLLRRIREARGASLRDVASRLGSSSANSYARYERGDVVPTVDKLDALVKAAAPDLEIVIRSSTN
jgi:predicted RNase H-like HicB family nuclease